MKEFKPIPIGVEDFKVIIDKGSYYVDKTGMIQEFFYGCYR
ncbi:MAG: AAA family ATPase [Ruminococcus sp.]|nr:AAA family ATPase [Ruminococcus sp.]